MDLDAGNCIKCVVVGDGAVGKTCLLMTYANNEFPDVYVPTIFDNYALSLHINGELYKLGLYDTAGQENYDRMRPLAYEGTSVFLVCFSVVDRSTFENVEWKWVPEILAHRKETPFILVGTKMDLREHGRYGEQFHVRFEDGQRLAKKLGAAGYLECSALTRDGLTELFNMAITIAIRSKENVKKRKCLIS